MLTLRHTVNFAIQVEVRNQRQARVVAFGLEATLLVLGLLYDVWFRLVDFWNDPVNNEWPELRLPDMGVAGQVAVIVLVSILFGMGVKL